jgi:putative flippase GtrA
MVYCHEFDYALGIYIGFALGIVFMWLLNRGYK